MIRDHLIERVNMTWSGGAGLFTRHGQEGIRMSNIHGNAGFVTLDTDPGSCGLHFW